MKKVGGGISVWWFKRFVQSASQILGSITPKGRNKDSEEKKIYKNPTKGFGHVRFLCFGYSPFHDIPP